MTAASIDQVVTNLGRRKHRSNPDAPSDPVRKFSYDVHDPRAQPWRRIGNGTLPFGKAFVAALTRTVTWLYRKQYDEGYCGADRLQRSHLQVLPALLSKLDFATGRLDPSWETIRAESRCSRGVIDRALEAFQSLGLVYSIRRTVPKEGAEGCRGPQREQTSSAFFFNCEAMAPDAYATFWSCLREELGRHGKWLKQQARAILNTFNREAVPSPREPKVARLVARARREEAERVARERPTGPAQAPVQAQNPVPAQIAPKPVSKLLAGIADPLAKMAARFGMTLDEALNASTE